MKIGNLILKNPLVLAPMAGVTDLPFRLMIKGMGAALVCSEMVSANGLFRNNRRSLEMLCSHPAEKPVSFQIFGSEPAAMAHAAAIVAEKGADVIDINMGCAVRKIVKNGAGVALMEQPEQAKRVMAAVRGATDRPVTVKIRSGFDPDGGRALLIARMAQDQGLDAVTVHPRTAGQGFSGRADWSVIARVARALSIPVIGNGDIVKPADAALMMESTGCAGAMIGRAAWGNPWIFSQSLDFLADLSPKEPEPTMRQELMKAFASDCAAHYGQTHACRILRSRLTWFVKGLPEARRFRDSITRIETLEQAFNLVDEYFDSIAAGEGALAKDF
ncbi:MAG: tRNA dihydrouridine synthase DusB [Desulfatibacillaceae bacterium]|nr:tRNA dihydrouridine synthase DusB [Desulfatibacillaceae bacterium]